MSEKNRDILLVVLIVGILSMTVAFAALTSRLNISGTANVASTKWNIRFENWTLDTASTVTIGGQTHQNTASYPTVAQLTKALNEGQDPNITKVSGITVTLNQPGDYVKYNFEIANRGTIAAKLNSKSHDLGSYRWVIQYDVDCYETNARTGAAIDTNYVLGVDDSVYCTLFVQYKDVTNTQTPGSNQVYQQSIQNLTTNLTAAWSWVQDGSSGDSSSSSNPYATTFDGTYNYIAPDTTTNTFSSMELDSNWNTYLRQDTTTNTVEACGKFSNGTVCVTQNDLLNRSDFEDCPNNTNITYYPGDSMCIKGYIKAKADEMISKGAIYCDVSKYSNSSTLNCKITKFEECSIGVGNGSYIYSRCYYDDYICSVYKDGSYECAENDS